MRPVQVLVSFAAVTLASAVQELTADTINTFTSEQDLSIILFDAPWCVHSREAAPEYDAAALMATNESWAFGHVDCAAEKALCDGFPIPIYPTLIVFHGQERNTYLGDRKAGKIAAFLRRHSHPVLTFMATSDEVDRFRSKDRVTVVGYFDRDDQLSTTTFAEIASSMRGEYLFGTISEETFGVAQSLKKPGIVLFKSFDEGKSLYTDRFDEEKIKDFINEAASPLISELGLDLRPEHAFSVEIPVAFIFAERDQRAQLVETLRPVAEAFKEQIGWVTGDPVEHASIASQVALNPGPWPAFAINDNVNDLSFVYPQRGSVDDLSQHAIRAFLRDFLAGKLQSDTLNASSTEATEKHDSWHGEL